MNRYLLNIAIIILISAHGYAQESILSLVKSDVHKADELYNKSAYLEAIELYKAEIKKSKSGHASLMLAKSFYEIKNYTSAVYWYYAYIDKGHKLDDKELLKFASALHGTGQYAEAIQWYKKYLEQNSDDEVVTKIWQLQNIHYLYEDSVLYVVKKLPINSDFDDIGPAFYDGSVVFLSNREQFKVLNRMDARTNKPFFSWYTADIIIDTTGQRIIDHVDLFASNIKAKYHKGNVCFDQSKSIMAFTRTEDSKNKSHTVSSIYFAKKDEKDNWIEYQVFPYNSDSYSLLHPHIANGGNTLYFTSDKPGGYGGTDLYRSDFQNGGWTTPVNLGEGINTSGNEGHAFLHGTYLYFSSDGHPGMGGLDIFEINLAIKPIDVLNLGYPVNTYYDDFSLVLDSVGTNGFMVSNRGSDNQESDDIYEINIKRHTFPLTVEGTVSYKNNKWVNTEYEPEMLSNAKLELIDKVKQKVLSEVFTDDLGKFKIEIPYESQYMLKVSKTEFGTATVSMEIPRNNQNFLKHDIVIVQDLFK